MNKRKKSTATDKIPGIDPDFCDAILGIFQSIPSGSEIVLFGSRAKGNYREGSDIDIAVKGPGFTMDDRNHWLAQYEDLYLPWKLDLVIYDEKLDPQIKEHIDTLGVLLLRAAGVISSNTC